MFDFVACYTEEEEAEEENLEGPSMDNDGSDNSIIFDSGCDLFSLDKS